MSEGLIEWDGKRIPLREVFNKYDRDRLKAYRQAVISGFFTDWDGITNSKDYSLAKMFGEISSQYVLEDDPSLPVEDLEAQTWSIPSSNPTLDESFGC